MRNRATDEADGFEDPYRHPFENKDLTEFVRLATKLSRGVAVSGNQLSASEHWVDYAFKGLVILGIAALVTMTVNTRDTVTRIDTYITQKDKENEREFGRIYKTLDGHDQ